MKPNFYNLKIFLKKIGNMLVVKAPTDYLDFEVKFATILQYQSINLIQHMK